MKTICCILIIALNLHLVSGQVNDKRYGVGLNINPNLTYRAYFINYTGDNVKERENSTRDFLNNEDYPRLNISIGIPFIMKISDKMIFESGLYFSQRGYGTSFTTELTDSSLLDEYSVLKYFRTEQKYSFIDIPMLIGYNFIEKETISFYGKIGLGFNWLIRSGRIVHLETHNGNVYDDSVLLNLKDLNNSEFGNINLSSIIAIGMSVNINQDIRLQFEPILNFMMTSLFDEQDSSRKFYETGLRIGCIYGF